MSALDASRLARAEELLREAVFQARASQAAGVSLSGHTLSDSVGPGNCGLGDAPGAGLALSDRGRELLGSLLESAPPPAGGTDAGPLLCAWVARQDAQDRKRNHFLKEFRRTHGFDRRSYGPELAQAFESGLDAINVEESRLRREAARALLEALSG